MLSPTASMYPLESVRPAMQAFWNEYTTRMELGPHELDEKLERAVAYAGARLLQTVYEMSAFSQSLAPQAMLALQASMNLVRQPRAAAEELIGMEAAAHV